VLLLAREVQPDWVLIDERLGRRVAQAMGLPVKGTAGILLAAFRARLLSRTQALEALQRLVERGIRISPKVITCHYSGDLGHPVRRHAGPRFRRKPAGVGAKRRWALDYLSHAIGGVKPARVFRIEPPFSVS